jgi:DNA-directed RNA polymerase subunit RPC12/RpoP
MDIEAAARPRGCPGCAAPMRRESYARKPLGTLDLDLCFDCQAIWFDAFESPQLAAGGVLALFRAIESLEGRAARPFGAVLRCVTCRERLALTHDIQRNNRIVYYRCPEGHGRFTTFLQFLREKDFVRSLTRPEIELLKASVAQVRCSSCGAPVDIARDAECPYCHAPISILDVDAVKREIDELGEQQRRGEHPDPMAAIDALLAAQRMPPPGDPFDRLPGTPLDLVHGALSLLTRGFAR